TTIESTPAASIRSTAESQEATAASAPIRKANSTGPRSHLTASTTVRTRWFQALSAPWATTRRAWRWAGRVTGSAMMPRARANLRKDTTTPIIANENEYKLILNADYFDRDCRARVCPAEAASLSDHVQPWSHRLAPRVAVAAGSLAAGAPGRTAGAARAAPRAGCAAGGGLSPSGAASIGVVPQPGGGATHGHEDGEAHGTGRP